METGGEYTGELAIDLADRDPDRYLVLPARRSREELAEAIAARVEALLPSPPPA